MISSSHHTLSVIWEVHMEVPEGSIRCSAHTDYGTLTILKSGGPGLQVSKDVQSVSWHDVPYVAPGLKWGCLSGWLWGELMGNEWEIH